MTHASRHKGKLITLEGIEGVGKSTHLETVRDHLKAHGIEAVATREPGGTPVGEGVRRLLLADREMYPETELLLLFAARAQHVRQVIRPALDTGQWVICDRFNDASYAYQGGGRGIPAGQITVLETWVLGDLSPDWTLLLDMDVHKALQRARARGAGDRFEQEAIRFFERVRQYYLGLAQTQSRFRIIDAAAPVETVAQAIRTALDALLQATGSGHV